MSNTLVLTDKQFKDFINLPLVKDMYTYSIHKTPADYLVDAPTGEWVRIAGITYVNGESQ